MLGWICRRNSQSRLRYLRYLYLYYQVGVAGTYIYQHIASADVSISNLLLSPETCCPFVCEPMLCAAAIRLRTQYLAAAYSSMIKHLNTMPTLCVQATLKTSAYDSPSDSRSQQRMQSAAYVIPFQRASVLRQQAHFVTAHGSSERRKLKVGCRSYFQKVLAGLKRTRIGDDNFGVNELLAKSGLSNDCTAPSNTRRQKIYGRGTSTRFQTSWCVILRVGDSLRVHLQLKCVLQVWHFDRSMI